MDNKNFEELSFRIVTDNIGSFYRSIVVADDELHHQYLVFYDSNRKSIAVHRLKNYKDNREIIHLELPNRLCTVPTEYDDNISNKELLSEFIKYSSMWAGK